MVSVSVHVCFCLESFSRSRFDPSNKNYKPVSRPLVFWEREGLGDVKVLYSTDFVVFTCMLLAPGV